ncbi:MAG TPA: hypothetical protein VD905_07960 [Flavobacteriales bacterium]|nr:hypothetical protein [Flavobacteriales bacterium]
MKSQNLHHVCMFFFIILFTLFLLSCLKKTDTNAQNRSGSHIDAAAADTLAPISKGANNPLD